MDQLFQTVDNLTTFANVHLKETILFICLVVSILIIAFFHHYIQERIIRALVVLSIIHIYQSAMKIYNQYVKYTKNKVIMHDKNNLTDYTNMNISKADLKIIKVFKKCDYSINKYYWNINCDSYFFYTNFHPKDEEKTLDQIMKTTKLRQYRKKLISDYFEECLYSYLIKENLDQMKELKSIEGLNINGLNIRNQHSIQAAKEENVRNDFNDLTPDVCITYNSKYTIIDAFNGSNETTIINKLRKYMHVSDDVYVFSSQVATYEQLTTKQSNQFKLFKLVGDVLEAVDEIRIGSFTIKITELNNLYYHHYSIFYAEVHYWLHCDNLGKIIQTHERDRDLS